MTTAFENNVEEFNIEGMEPLPDVIGGDPVTMEGMVVSAEPVDPNDLSEEDRKAIFGY